LLGKGKSGYSYLASWNERPVVFKRMHNEPCPYYQFTGNKVEAEVQAYQRLQAIGIPLPELLDFNPEQQYLIKTYCEGLSGAEWLANGGQDEDIIQQLFLMAQKLRIHNLNIDYFPANFVINLKKIYYIDYEVNPYQDKWSLEQWGIYYWANREGMAEYHNSGNWQGINQRAGSGMPIKAPFEKQVEKWKAKYK